MTPPDNRSYDSDVVCPIFPGCGCHILSGRRLEDEGRYRTHYRGTVDFLMPDGGHFRAQCDARFTHERWQGVLNLNGFDRGLEQGDVCRMSASPFGDLRVIILDRVGTQRYEFIGLIKPDPFESL